MGWARLVEAERQLIEKQKAGFVPGLLIVIARFNRRARASGRLKILSGALVGATVLNDVVTDLLPVHERAHAGALNGRNMNENVHTAIVGLNEAKAFGRVEPLHGASVHNEFPFSESLDFPHYLAGLIDYLKGNRRRKTR